MKFIVNFFFIFLVVSGYCQKKNYYTLEKNGKLYPKIIRFIELKKSDSIIDKNDTILFNIGKQQFVHFRKNHIVDTCNITVLKKIKLVSINQLLKDEYNEHLDKTKRENIKIPLPLKHYNSKVYIIRTITNNKVIKYEVEWPYSIN